MWMFGSQLKDEHVYACKHIRTHAFLYATDMCMQVCFCINIFSVYVRAHLCICPCSYVSMRICVIYVHVYMYAYMIGIYVDVCVHVWMHFMCRCISVYMHMYVQCCTFLVNSCISPRAQTMTCLLLLHSFIQNTVWRELDKC